MRSRIDLLCVTASGCLVDYVDTDIEAFSEACHEPEQGCRGQVSRGARGSSHCETDKKVNDFRVGVWLRLKGISDWCVSVRDLEIEAILAQLAQECVDIIRAANHF